MLDPLPRRLLRVQVLREFKDGHLKVEQAVVMLKQPDRPSSATPGGPWRVSEAALVGAADFHKAQIIGGLRRMVVAFDQVT